MTSIPRLPLSEKTTLCPCAQMGPKQPHSTLQTLAEGALIVMFHRHTLRPPEATLLRPSPPTVASVITVIYLTTPGPR